MDWLKNKSKYLISIPDCFQFNALLQDVQIIFDKHPQAEAFEEFVSNLDERDEVTIHQCLRLMFCSFSGSKSIDLGFQNRGDLYDDLIVKLNINSTDWSIVSLNYDLLFEQALDRAGIPYEYASMPGDDCGDSVRSRIVIYKPHGSINFSSQFDFKFSYDGSDPPFGRPSEITKHEGFTSITPGNIFILNSGCHGSLEDSYYPIIAKFCEGKPSFICWPKLDEIRKDALELVKRSSETFVVGVRPSSHYDDSFVHGALLSAGKITYISPAQDDCSEVQRLNPNATCITKTLKEFLRKEALN